MKRVIGFIMMVMAAVALNAQLLWKVEGGGLKSPSYIFGTHHLASIAMLDSVPAIRSAMKETQQVVGEISLAEMQIPANIQLMQSNMMVADSDSIIRKLLPEEAYKRVNSAVKTYLKFDLAEMPNLKPSFISNNIVIAIYVAHVGGFNPQEQLDSFFQEFAGHMERRVIGLETPEFQFNLLYNSQPLSRQAEDLLCVVDNVSKSVVESQQLLKLYMKQDIDAMLRLSQQLQNDGCDMSPEEMETMVYSRNRDWAERLPAIMAEAPSLIVVGALHLPGDDGLINLLKKKGYKISKMAHQ